MTPRSPLTTATEASRARRRAWQAPARRAASYPRLLANLLLFDVLLFDVLHAARLRGELSPTARVPFWVSLDEVQSYDGVASGNLAALLEQSAKFGIRAVLLNQNPERLDPRTLNALTTNRSHLLSSALNSHAASLLTKEWGGKPGPAALTRLPRYRFISQVTHDGQISRAFALGGVRVEDVLGPPLTAAKTASGIRTAPAREVLAHQEDLDERIAAEMRGLAKAGKALEPEGEQEPATEGALTTWTREAVARASSEGLPLARVEVLASLVQHQLLSTDQVRRIQISAAGFAGPSGCSPHSEPRGSPTAWSRPGARPESGSRRRREQRQVAGTERSRARPRFSERAKRRASCRDTPSRSTRPRSASWEQHGSAAMSSGRSPGATRSSTG